MKAAAVPQLNARLELNLTYDEGQLRADLSALSSVPSGERKAMARAVDRALKGTRTDIVADLRSRTVLKAGTIRKGISVLSPRWQGAAQITGSVRVETKRLQLTEYKVSPLRPTAQKGRKPKQYKTLTYRLARGGKAFDNSPQVESRSRLFVAMVKGRLGVFARPGAEREKLIAETGPSLQAFYARTTRQQHILTQADLRFRKELAHQITHLGGGGK